MSKKVIQIISLILSVIGLIYLILSYYGIIRYFKLHFISTDIYTENFKNLPKASKNRVTVCFSADDKQLKNIKPFINSILDQTVRVDDIALTIPYRDMDKIPKNLKDIISPYGYSKDYDNAGNFICSILRETEAETKIIIVEPDKVYGEDFIENLVEESEKNPNKILYVGKEKVGILLKPKFFNDKISDYEKGKGCCTWIKDCSNAEEKIIEYSPIFKSIKYFSYKI